MVGTSSAVEPLKDVPQFTHLLTMFTNPLLGMLAGLILTAIIQSSSASVGILQALCSTGAVSFGCAIPIIMGHSNISITMNWYAHASIDTAKSEVQRLIA